MKESARERQHQTVLRYMPGVQAQQQDLRLVEAAWDSLALLSSLSRLTSQTSSGTDLGRARKDFSSLSTEMVRGLVAEAYSNVKRDLESKAQVVIDILVRNLFERTADIGFLSLDEVLIEYASEPDVAQQPAVEQRLRDYVSYYSVYRSVHVLNTDLELLASVGRPSDRGFELTTQDTQVLRGVLASQSAYVEHFGHLNFLQPSGNSLIYAKRLMAGQEPVGVLCLEFRLADELPAIFDVLLRTGKDTAAVLALLDQDNCVIGSSDGLQLPAGWKLDLASQGGPGIFRHMGREYLMVSQDTNGFEGYYGPGWRGVALLPLELAFEQASHDYGASSELMEEVASHPDFLSGELRLIPSRSQAIRTALERSVWNGLIDVHRIESTGNAAASDVQFAQTLLSEIGVTAQKTARAFANALRDLHRVVTHAMVGDAEHRASMVMQILDRNLYERANDCRWWALTPTLIRALAEPDTTTAHDAHQVLAHINSLYTVYSALVLLDSRGRIVATSRPEMQDQLGTQLDESWVSAGLQTPLHKYAVSSWQPSSLYPSGQSTFIYSAAIHDPLHAGRSLGCIAVVWDAGSQVPSILRDCSQGCDEYDALVLHNAHHQSAACTGPVVSPSQLADAVQATHDLPPGETICDLSGQLYGLGMSTGVGYREFRQTDGYDHGLRCAMLKHLCQRKRSGADARHLRAIRQLRQHDKREWLKLATFTVLGHWMAVPADWVLFASPDLQVLSAGRHQPPLVGLVEIARQVYPVIDLRTVVGQATGEDAISREASSSRQLVILRIPSSEADSSSRHVDLALRIDALATIQDVPVPDIKRMAQGARDTNLINQVVGINLESAGAANENRPQEQALLMIIALNWLQRCLQAWGPQQAELASFSPPLLD